MNIVFYIVSRGTHLSVVGYDVYFFESFLVVLEDDAEMSQLLMYNNFPQLLLTVFNHPVFAFMPVAKKSSKYSAQGLWNSKCR